MISKFLKILGLQPRSFSRSLEQFFLTVLVTKYHFCLVWQNKQVKFLQNYCSVLDPHFGSFFSVLCFQHKNRGPWTFILVFEFSTILRGISILLAPGYNTSCTVVVRNYKWIFAMGHPVVHNLCPTTTPLCHQETVINFLR